MHKDLIARLNADFPALSVPQRLALAARTCANIALTTSLGPEDQLLTHAIAATGAPIHIVTLQTGRLFPETLDLLARTRARYGISIEEFGPDDAAVDTYARQHGLNGFYDSAQARHACCAIRKVEPLKRALSGRDGWITGLRRQQSPARSGLPFVEWSQDHQLLKFNPLADVLLDTMNETIAREAIPVNALHERGFPSIGCEPCTRAVKPGEPERAGRWWWEQSDTRECGLHVAAPQTDGRQSVVAKLLAEQTAKQTAEGPARHD